MVTTRSGGVFGRACRPDGSRRWADCEVLLEIAHQISTETDPAVSRIQGRSLLRYPGTNFERLFGGKCSGSILYRTPKKTAGRAFFWTRAPGWAEDARMPAGGGRWAWSTSPRWSRPQDECAEGRMRM